MITLDSIFENIIAELIVVILSLVIPKIYSIYSKKENTLQVNSFDMLNAGIFLTSISILNLIINLSFWNNQKLTVLFTLLALGFGVSTGYIYNNQCPACKRFIRAKKKIDEKIIKEYTKEIQYQPMKIWKYSNGRIKKKEPSGSKKIRIEKWQTKQEFYECPHCKNKWDSCHVEVPLIIEKEVHTAINTREQDPEEPTIY